MDDNQLQQINPLKNLSAIQRKDLLDAGKRDQVPMGAKIKAPDLQGWFFMLLVGEVKIIPLEGQAHSFDAESSRAMDPIFIDAASRDTAKFTSDSIVLRISRKRVQQAEQAINQEVAVNDTEIDSVAADVIRMLFEDFHRGAINVPAMPEIAVRVRTLVDNDDTSLGDLAELIEQDPSLAGKLIAAANSALIRGRTEICTAEEALMRMGQQRACNVVVSLAIKEMFAFRSSTLAAAGARVWMTATHVAAICRIVAQKANSSELDPEKAFMIGLLHNVGSVAVLGYLEKQGQDLPGPAVDKTLENLRAVSTTLVLNKWRMDKDFFVAGEEAEEPETRENPYFAILELGIQQVGAAQTVAEDQIPQEQDIHQLKGLVMLGDQAQLDEHGRLLLLHDHPELSALSDNAGVENAA